jgi:hypothetical protein
MMTRTVAIEQAARALGGAYSAEQTLTPESRTEAARHIDRANTWLRLAEQLPPDGAEAALDKVVAWLDDPRLHCDPGTLEDMYAAITATGRRLSSPEPLACCAHLDDDGPDETET